LVWFRQDLRRADHPALAAAVREARAVLPVYIWAPEEEDDWAPGAAARVGLHACLAALAGDLEARGSRLIYRQGPPARILVELARQVDADAVYWNQRYEPAARRQEARVTAALSEAGITVRTFPGGLLHDPAQLLNRSGKPYKVFGPFARAFHDHYEHAPPLRAPASLQPPARWPRGDALERLGLLPRVDWAAGIRRFWSFGETAARRQLRRFMVREAARYDERRDQLAEDGTSRLSMALHFGCLSPHQVWDAAREELKRQPAPTTREGIESFMRQIVWREFAHHVLYHFPHTVTQPLRPEFARFPWRRSRRDLRAWQRGRTGYPIVDAAMRQLWETGWMHNRARMIVASFLVKDLLLPWQAGAAWFWDTLVDADLANNTFGWQWTAGCGADAAPYFRIFNPALQGRKFDPEASYVQRYVPALSAITARDLHGASEALPDRLRQAGIALGRAYPEPIVDHAEARERALEALAAVSQQN